MNKAFSKLLNKEGAFRASEMPEVKSGYIKLPSPSLNWALGGGIQRGKIVTVYGPESAGKSLIAQLAAASEHKLDPEAAIVWYDAEYSFNPSWAKKLGVDLDRTLVYRTNSVAGDYLNSKGEKILGVFEHIHKEIIPAVIAGAPIKLLVVDSVKALRGPRELKAIEKDGLDKENMGNDVIPAMNRGFKAILEFLRDFGVTVVLIQQVNEEMDPQKSKYNKYYLPGGRSLRHNSDYMIFVDKVGSKDKKEFDPTLKNANNTDVQVGHTIRARMDKNRVAAPFRVAEFKINYTKGVTGVEDELLELAKQLGVIHNGIAESTGKLSSKHWTFGPLENIFGWANFCERVKTTDGILERIENALYTVTDEQVEAAALVDSTGYELAVED